MKVAVLGYGSQGVSSVEYWRGLGHDVTVCDKNPDLVLPGELTAQLGAGYLEGLDKFDLVVRSPSIHPQDIAKANPQAVAILNIVTTNTNEFMAVCPSRNIIGVTGTKGKGTTSTLITKMLEETGKRVHLGGNIGTPPLEMLKADVRPEDWVVLELANFQLIDLKHSPSLAVCLMIEAEHQDWHTGVEEYIRAKQQLFRWQKPEDTAVFYAKNALSQQVVSVSKGKKTPYFEKPGAKVENNRVIIDGSTICDVTDIKLLGKHNWQNICAAVTAAWQVTQDVGALRNAIKHTAGLPFRLEYIRELNGVKYYNDSFGTTPATAIVAIEAFEQPKIVILGGSDKGSPFDELAKTIINNNVKHVVAIGDTADNILDKIGLLSNKRSVAITKLEGKPAMREIIAAARSKAEPGDVILLSTGCASFGLFENYKDRGEKFNEAVRSLA